MAQLGRQTTTIQRVHTRIQVESIWELTPFNDFNGTFGTSNILPESPLVNDIFARPGSGAFTGLFRTGFDNGTDFNNLRIRSVNSLDGSRLELANISCSIRPPAVGWLIGVIGCFPQPCFDQLRPNRS